MKLPGPLSQLFSPKKEGKDVFLSMILDAQYVAVSAWQMSDRGLPHILATATKTVVDDTWEARTQTADRALAEIEEKLPATVPLTKVILGLPAAYLTPGGDILKDVRGHIKKLTRVLTLEPIGFVPTHQAIIFRMKKDEGVPPSVILLHVSGGLINVSIYRVGSLVGQREVEHTKDAVHGIEAALKDFKEVEVLPARMLLYDGKGEDLEALKTELLKHQWPTKVNFLHFPKIEILTNAEVVSAVSLAGASELRSAMGEEEPADVEAMAGKEEEVAAEETLHAEAKSEEAESVVAKNKYETVVEEEASDEETITAVADGGKNEEQEALQKLAEEEVPETTLADDNVVMVDPEELGFHKDVDVLATVSHKASKPIEQVEEIEEEEKEDEEEEVPARKLAMPAALSSFKLPHVSVPRFSLPENMPSIGVAGPVLGILVLLGVIAGIGLWVLPHATITVYEVAQPISKTLAVTIDPTASVASAVDGIVPGKKQEKSVSGEKTVPVTGTKNVGDPAKGSVTIYNKATSSRTFRKGTVLVFGKLQFTLNDDVQVASASESIGSITFGKAAASVTAVQIGPTSNLPANTEFSFKDTSSSIAIARNESAFSGGTSKEVTVVSRADYDGFVEAITTDLVAQAKKELAASVGGGAKLIDDTIKTEVTEKVFNQEINQEAKELSGKVTIAVTGIAYSDDDLKALAQDALAKDVPSGYSLSEGRTAVTLSRVTVKKDGKITALAAIDAVALPKLDAKTIQSALSSKSIKQAEEYLRGVTGVGAVEFSFRYSLSKNRLPMNKNNISVSLAVQE